MYTEKRVGPRIEPCGTPIETARGPDNRPSDLTHWTLEVVGEPGEEIIWKTKAVESANKNVVIDRAESLGQVDEYSYKLLWNCVVASLCILCYPEWNYYLILETTWTHICINP